MIQSGILDSIRSREFWFQVYMTTFSNLKARYRSTFAGMFWVILGPLVVYAVQSYIFIHVLWINVPDYSQFLLSGLLAWIFISQSVDSCTAILTNKGRLLTAYSINPIVLLTAQLLDNFINFLLAFFVLVTPILLFADSRIRFEGILVFPIGCFILVVGTFGFCWLFSMINVYFRDSRFILGFMLQVAYFATPIIYPISMVPPRLRWVVEANPFYRIIEPIRIAIYDFRAEMFWPSALKGLIVSVGVLFLAAFIWRKRRNDIFLQI